MGGTPGSASPALGQSQDGEPRPHAPSYRPRAHLAAAGQAAGAHGRRGARREAGSHWVCTPAWGVAVLTQLAQPPQGPALPRGVLAHGAAEACTEGGAGRATTRSHWTPGLGVGSQAPGRGRAAFQVFVLCPRVPGAVLTWHRPPGALGPVSPHMPARTLQPPPSLLRERPRALTTWHTESQSCRRPPRPNEPPLPPRRIQGPAARSTAAELFPCAVPTASSPAQEPGPGEHHPS